MNLPLTFVYFLFMIIANLLIPFYFGVKQDVTFELGGQSLTLPIYTLPSGFSTIYTWDFFLITMLTFFAPVLCFIVGMIKTPRKLIKFISHSTAMYAALGPLSSIGVLTYFISGKAIFLVTGDQQQDAASSEEKSHWLDSLRQGWQYFLQRSHPDTWQVRSLEILVGFIFAIACIFMFQISFLGLCLAFAFMPVMHSLGWENKFVSWVVHLPFVLILLGILLAGANLIGMQTVFFGYGFHF